MSSFNPDIIDAHWIRGEEMSFPEKVEIYTSRINKLRNNGNKKVLNLVNEPRAFRQKNKEIIENHKKFDLILSFDPQILNRCPNARNMLCGMTWINDEGRDKCSNKEYGVSFLCGAKRITEGHNLRHKIWNNQQFINMPRDFWISSAQPVKPHNDTNKKLPGLETEKYLLFKREFHICVENSVEESYFTEKIMDCFTTKTVPIYYGCPNLGEYFDMKGVLQFKTLGGLIEICKNLKEGDYKKLKVSIEKNYDISIEYTRDFTKRLEDKINQNLFSK